MSAPVRTIKKYPNRRLYDTANSGYITLADVKQMVLENIEFQVVDAKSGEDLTRAILLLIILEEESGGLPMFSSEMLTQLIRFYGTAQQTMMGQYMEQNVKAFLAIQKKLQDQAKQVYGDKMMLTHVYLKKGCVVPKHSHHNEQLTYVLEGALKFFVGDEGAAEIVVHAGEVLHLPGNVPHEAHALEDTLDVDVFYPPREDWLNKTDAYLRK